MPAIVSTTSETKPFFPILVVYYDQSWTVELNKWNRHLQQIVDVTDLETLVAHVIGSPLWVNSLHFEWFSVARGKTPGIYIRKCVTRPFVLYTSSL